MKKTYYYHSPPNHVLELMFKSGHRMLFRMNDTEVVAIVITDPEYLSHLYWDEERDGYAEVYYFTPRGSNINKHPSYTYYYGQGLDITQIVKECAPTSILFRLNEYELLKYAKAHIYHYFYYDKVDGYVGQVLFKNYEAP